MAMGGGRFVEVDIQESMTPWIMLNCGSFYGNEYAAEYFYI
jgi:hypothetical protein